MAALRWAALAVRSLLLRVLAGDDGEEEEDERRHTAARYRSRQLHLCSW
jgi:hypothetical protein